MDYYMERLSKYIKYFFRRLYNGKKKTGGEYNENSKMASSSSGWETPFFASIKKKKTKRLSPYPETVMGT